MQYKRTATQGNATQYKTMRGDATRYDTNADHSVSPAVVLVCERPTNLCPAARSVHPNECHGR
eukprot:9493199-Alexandrium_andersonii.AAC.1